MKKIKIKKGSALVWLLAVMIGVGIVTASLVSSVMLETKSTYRAKGHNQVIYNLESLLQDGLAQARYALDNTGVTGKDMFMKGSDKIKKPDSSFFTGRGLSASDVELFAGPLPDWPKSVEYLDPESSLYQHDPEGGKNAYIRELPIIAKVKQKVPGLADPITMYAKAVLQIRDVPIYSYALLIGIDTFIGPGNPMTIAGPVQVNNNFATGAREGLIYEDKLMVAGDLLVYRNQSGFDNSAAYNSKGVLKPFKQGSKYFESDMPNWRQKAINRWDGNVKTSVHNILSRSLPAFIEEASKKEGSIHSLIEPQLSKNEAGFDPWIEAEKYAGKAGTYIYIKVPEKKTDAIEVEAYYFANGSDYVRYDDNHLMKQWRRVPLNLKASKLFDSSKPYDSDYVIRTMKDPAKRITMTDAGRALNVDPINLIEIDIEKLRKVVEDNKIRDWNGVVYVEVQMVDNKGNPYKYGTKKYFQSQATGVRLINAKKIPKDGLTIATNTAMYVLGNFNADGKMSTGTDSKREDKDEPLAAIVGDMVTMLSNDWDDNKSDKDTSQRVVSSPMEVAAVIIAGSNNPNYPWGGKNPIFTSKDLKSTGVHNVPRLIEVWKANDLRIRGGVVSLWHREVAWELPPYNIHSSATRLWGFNEELKKGKYPPGIPPTLRSYRNLTIEFITEKEYNQLKSSF